MDQNTQNRNDSNVLLYDPLIVVRDVIKRWMIILLAALMMGIGAYIHADMSYVPQYSATTTYVVAARGTSSTVFSSLSSTTSMASARPRSVKNRVGSFISFQKPSTPISVRYLY